MNCPVCTTELKNTKQHDVMVPTCSSCNGLFVLEEELKLIETKEDPFLRWLDPDLWKHEDKYEAKHGERSCPSCANHMHTLKYMRSNIEIEVCHECRAVWLEKGELEKILTYLEEKITNETVAEYFKELGSETLDVIKGKEDLKSLQTVLKLLGYRIFTQFPSIRRLIQSLPKM